MSTLLVLGLALAFGLLSTRLMKIIHLPNVTGYLLIGLLIGPYCLNFMSLTSLHDIEIITTVALGFIAFSIGSSFKLSHLREVGKNVITITCFEAITAVVLVDAIFILIGQPIAMSIMFGAIAAATAPAATLMVVRQYKAKGPVTNTLLPVVASDDAIGLMLYSISIAIAKVLVSGGAITVKATIIIPLLEIGGSLITGAILGALLSLASRYFKSRANRITLIIASALIGVAVSQIDLGDGFHFSSLLVCMMIGAMYTNMFKEYSRPLDVLDRWTYPCYMLFFIISGAELRLDAVPMVGLIGIIYICVRFGGKYFGARIGAKVSNAKPIVQKYLGFSLLPQAGVAIGMAQMVVHELPEYGMQINTVILCATLVYELIGPVVTKWALTQAGEIKTPKKKTPTEPKATA